MMQPELLLQFSVIRGLQLPKTELTSKIDAYVKVKAGTFSAKTRTRDDEDNPVWDESFFFTVPMSASKSPAGIITLELWDSNTLKDTHVGTARLDLSALQPSQLGYIELPLAWEKEKYGKQGRQSRLVVGVPGWIASFGTLMSALHQVPGALFNTVSRHAYVPLPHPSLPHGLLYLGCEYEADAVDFKVFVTQPNALLFVDLAMASRQHTKVRRRVYRDGFTVLPGLTVFEEFKLDDVPLLLPLLLLLLLLQVRRRVYRDGFKVLPGLTVFEEIKLDDVPLSTDLRQLMVLAFDKALLWTLNADQVVSSHGWRGALGFAEACRALHSVDVDYREQEIFMSLPNDVPGVPPEAMLLVDYDKNDVDIKLAVLSTPSAMDKGYDITLHSGQPIKKTSEIFLPPKSKIEGRYQVARIYELDDVAYGTSFSDILLHKFQLSSQRQWEVAALLPLK
uniref:C2 domain-containing protein n=1 Tax=Tetradesmus obliquus TaxID=3088 RepID=A0A383WDE8_TETOB|eukprot:jgi/Sobl393_1/1866/SZX75280.1